MESDHHPNGGDVAVLGLYPCAERIGFAKLTTMAFGGADLRPIQQALTSKIAEGSANAGDGLDLSLIEQLLGNKQAGLAIQSEILAFHQLYRSPCVSDKPKLRVLALAAAMDMGGNTPIEFLLENSDIELATLYVVDGVELPSPLPDHDVAIVIASDSRDCQQALNKIGRAASHWPRALLNPPHLVGNLDRGKLHRLLHGIEGIDIPSTVSASRDQLSEIVGADAGLTGLSADLQFPVIIRPVGSHAGVGLLKLDDMASVGRYIAGRPEQEFFLSRFVDYASADGLFRKYRIVIIDGQAYACHMAIADRWDIWYLNAGMTVSENKRLEEASFMHTFDIGFAARHRKALAAMIGRVGLDYFTVDCAENQAGDLLIFEADNTAVVHNMDSPVTFPYKPPQMQAIFEAFAAMLVRRAGEGESRERAA